MIASPYFVELSSDDEAIANNGEFTILEVEDDDGNQFTATIEEIEDDGDDDIMILEDPVDVAETVELQPVIVEPEDEKTKGTKYLNNIELWYNSNVLESQPLISPETTVRDMFELARYHIDFKDPTKELWFNFEPIGLEIGEDNNFTSGPTMGDLVRLIDLVDDEEDEPVLKIKVKERDSFYHKFQTMLNNLDISDEAESTRSESKRRKRV